MDPKHYLVEGGLGTGDEDVTFGTVPNVTIEVERNSKGFNFRVRAADNLANLEELKAIVQATVAELEALYGKPA